MSPSEMTPSTWPCMSHTGKPEIRLSIRILATSLIGASGPIMRTFRVMISSTLIVPSRVGVGSMFTTRHGRGIRTDADRGCGKLRERRREGADAERDYRSDRSDEQHLDAAAKE